MAVLFAAQSLLHCLAVFGSALADCAKVSSPTNAAHAAAVSCPSDAVVWVNSVSKILSSERQPQLRQDRNRRIYVRTGLHRCRIPRAQTGAAHCGLIVSRSRNMTVSLAAPSATSSGAACLASAACRADKAR